LGQTSRRNTKTKVHEGLYLTRRGPRLTDATFRVACRMLFSQGSAPDDYLRFLKCYNGGVPQPGYFEYQHNDETRTDQVIQFLQVDPGPYREPSGYHIVEANLDCRHQLPRECVMIGQLESDGLLILYLWGERCGQVWVVTYPEGIMNESDIEPSLAFVAPSFSRVLQKLHSLPATMHQFLFSLDYDAVVGESLSRKLKSLGCNPTNYGSKKDNWFTWAWPKHKLCISDDLPATIDVGRNGNIGFAQLHRAKPKGHPLLRLSVASEHAVPSRMELMQCLGKRQIKLLSTATR
jgi:hypothetical protein